MKAVLRADPWGPLGGPLGAKTEKMQGPRARTGGGTVWPWRRVVSNALNNIECLGA